MLTCKRAVFAFVEVTILSVFVFSSPGWAGQDDADSSLARQPDSNLDRRLARMLHQAGFTGRVESTLERRLRPSGQSKSRRSWAVTLV